MLPLPNIDAMTRGASIDNPDNPKRIGNTGVSAEIGASSGDGGAAVKASSRVSGNPPALGKDPPSSGDSTKAGPSLLVPPPFDPRSSPLVSAPGALLDAIAAERLDPDWLRRRFARPPAWTPEQSSDRIVLRPGPPRPAAVLVPIVAHGGAPTVLLTQRTLHLRNHSGQVAFPGGRFEPDDVSPVRTALREAHEEVGLDPGRVEVIGRLPDYLTGTGYRVTPVVGLIPPGESLRPDPHEVAAIFEVPLGFLMDPRHHEQRLIEVQGASRMFWAMPYRALDSDDEYFIWGATAAMLRNLYRLLAA